MGNMTIKRVPGPTGTTYLTLGQASDRTERVRIAPDGVAPWEVPTLGAGTSSSRPSRSTPTPRSPPWPGTAILGRTERPKLPSS